MSLFDREMLALMRRVSEAAILPRFGKLGSGEVHDKARAGEAADPVTIADREAEAMLADGLAKLSPGLSIVGEEAAHEDPGVLDSLAGPCWIVDPLDGTRNFASGQEPFGIIIAMADGGIAQAGWIYDCLSGRFCAAHAGKGAFMDGERITAQPTGEDPPVAAISLIFMEETKRAAMSGHIAPHYRLTDIPYCAAEQYPRLALGTNDVSIFERTLAWDHAPGVLWLNEAGGKAARPDGTRYRVDEWDRKGMIGAATPALFDELAGRLATLASR